MSIKTEMVEDIKTLRDKITFKLLLDTLAQFIVGLLVFGSIIAVIRYGFLPAFFLLILWTPVWIGKSFIGWVKEIKEDWDR